MLKKHLTITTQLRKSSLNYSDITEATTTETTPKIQHSSFARDLNSISKIDFLKQIIKATLSTAENWQISLQIEHFPGFNPYSRNYNYILGSKAKKSQEGNQSASITKESLIERVTSDFQLTNSVYPILLYTCEWYFDSHEMFTILLKHFKMPLPLGLSPAERLSFLTSIVSRIQTKVLTFIKDWLKLYSYKFQDNPLLKEVFLEMLYIMLTHPDTGKWINPLISQIMNDFEALKTTEQTRPKYSLKVTSLPEIFIPFPVVLSYSHLLAKQLCIFDQENFQQINLVEFCKKAWTKADKAITAPNLTYIAEMSTKLSRLTSYFILMNKQVSFRVMIYQYLIDLCDQLVILKNFNSAFAIYLGVMSNAVQRLKHTFEPQVSKTYKDTLENLSEIFSANNNLENLRKKQSQADSPVIPYLGVYLSDLIFTEELPDYNDEERKMLNINKFQVLSDKVSKILNFKEPYGFHRVDVIINYIKGIPFISEDQVYNLSDQLLSKDPLPC